MTARATSLEAYSDLRSTGKLGNQAHRIVGYVASHGPDCSLQEISRGTGLPINAVSGRVNDCKKAGVLFEKQRRKCHITGRSVIPVSARREPEQLQLRAVA